MLLREGLPVCSNAAVPGVSDLDAAAPGAHRLIDLGADEYTQGRPHPMIEPAVRDAELARAIADPTVGIVLVDLVLGYGGARRSGRTLPRGMAATDDRQSQPGRTSSPRSQAPRAIRRAFRPSARFSPASPPCAAPTPMPRTSPRGCRGKAESGTAEGTIHVARPCPHDDHGPHQWPRALRARPMPPA